MLMIVYKNNHIVTHENVHSYNKKKGMMDIRGSSIFKNGLSCHGQVSFSDIFLKKKTAILTKPN